MKWLLVNLLPILSTGQFVFKAGPLVPATKGEVWPLPQSVNNLDDGYFTFLTSFFQFNVAGNTCKILRDAVDRYRSLILFNSRKVKTLYYTVKPCYYSTDSNFLGYLTQLEIVLTGQCGDNDYPYLGMDEKYQLVVSRNSQKLTSDSIWGILRGLETFSQLIYLSNDYSCHIVETVEIEDFPRFVHRGLLLDTSRHYQTEENILNFIDAMSWNKLNVFHWHITDDYSFPYVSRTFPQMSEKGAFHPTLIIYSQDFVKTVIEFGRVRGVRVMVEFDTPGHTLSWGLGNPILLTKCYDVPSLEWGPLDPTKESSFTFVFRLYDEIRQVFKDKYVHVGGDEVDFSCWESNPQINQWMATNNFTTGDYKSLQSYYTQRLIAFTKTLNLTSVVWEEVFTNANGKLDPSAVVNVWISDLHNPNDTLSTVTAAGYQVINSAHWYLDKLAPGGDWLKYYNADPQDFSGTEEQKKLVIGAEACMFTEVVDSNNLEPRVWPRAAVAAERFWSAPGPYLDPAKYDAIIPTAARLEEQTCRLKRRGIMAQPPVGPSVCF